MTPFCLYDILVGKRLVTGLYSDNSGELKKACKIAKIQHDGGQPGVPQTNAIIERTNLDIVHGARCCLDPAGLPPCFGSFAAPCYCFLENTTHKISEVGVSAWFKSQGADFEGLRVPFGCKVIYMPSDTKATSETGKWDSPTSIGVFAGYWIQPGYTWHGEYLVWNLVEFADLDCSLDGARLGRTFGEHHVVKRVTLCQDTISFPLKAEYERVNNTLEGIKAQASREDGGLDSAQQFAWPPDPLHDARADDVPTKVDRTEPIKVGGSDATGGDEPDDQERKLETTAVQYRRVQDGIQEKLHEQRDLH